MNALNLTLRNERLFHRFLTIELIVHKHIIDEDCIKEGSLDEDEDKHKFNHSDSSGLPQDRN